MDPLSAALVAAGAAWLSIFAAAHLPASRLDLRAVRLTGAASLALLGLAALGLPVPAWAPVAVLAAGMAGTALWSLARRPATAL